MIRTAPSLQGRKDHETLSYHYGFMTLASASARCCALSHCGPKWRGRRYMGRAYDTVVLFLGLILNLAAPIVGKADDLLQFAE
jgi:hypothetical protein